MIVAIYARKSTDQNVSDEEKSVTRQIQHARAYAAKKGWTVADAHVYSDDGISGVHTEGGRGRRVLRVRRSGLLGEAADRRRRSISVVPPGGTDREWQAILAFTIDAVTVIA